MIQLHMAHCIAGECGGGEYVNTGGGSKFLTSSPPQKKRKKTIGHYFKRILMQSETESTSTCCDNIAGYSSKSSKELLKIMAAKDAHKYAHAAQVFVSRLDTTAEGIKTCNLLLNDVL
jgi:hypothetical protein